MNTIRHKTCRHFRNEKKEYVKERSNELATAYSNAVLGAINV
jgi:hypothetical protein